MAKIFGPYLTDDASRWRLRDRSLLKGRCVRIQFFIFNLVMMQHLLTEVILVPA
ncbi:MULTISPECIES: hypothetical protein [Aerosakkonema]|uniref:hypothetical protein n=1 Tax=Aerosakkonema TaxID=1246629 RepID=UPI0035B9546C